MDFRSNQSSFFPLDVWSLYPFPWSSPTLSRNWTPWLKPWQKGSPWWQIPLTWGEERSRFHNSSSHKFKTKTSHSLTPSVIKHKKANCNVLPWSISGLSEEPRHLSENWSKLSRGIPSSISSGNQWQRSRVISMQWKLWLLNLPEAVYQCSYSAGMYPHEHPYWSQLVN